MKISSYKLGAHISIASGIENVPEISSSMGFNAFQVFVKSRSWRKKNYNDDEIERFKENIKRFNIKGTAAHAIYLINLASENNIRERSIYDINEEINLCNDLNIDYIVVHPGSNPDKNKGIKMVIDALQSIETGKTMVLIENSSGKGNTFPSSIEEMSLLLDDLDKDHFGLCLDTCHAYAYGYDLCNYDSFKDNIKKHLNFNDFKLIHLNDSKSDLGSKKDLHENPGSGTIGRCIRYIFYDSDFRDSIYIMESPDIEMSYDKNINFLLGDNIENRKF